MVLQVTNITTSSIFRRIMAASNENERIAVSEQRVLQGRARIKDAMASRGGGGRGTTAIDYENVRRSNDKRHPDGCTVR